MGSGKGKSKQDLCTLTVVVVLVVVVVVVIVVVSVVVVMVVVGFVDAAVPVTALYIAAICLADSAILSTTTMLRMAPSKCSMWFEFGSIL